MIPKPDNLRYILSYLPKKNKSTVTITTEPVRYRRPVDWGVLARYNSRSALLRINPLMEGLLVTSNHPPTRLIPNGRQHHDRKYFFAR